MIVVGKELEARLDRAWYELQKAVEGQFDHSISQKFAIELMIGQIEHATAVLKMGNERRKRENAKL